MGEGDKSPSSQWLWHVPCDEGFALPARVRRVSAVRGTPPRPLRAAREVWRTAGSWVWTQTGTPGPDSSLWSGLSAGSGWTAARTAGYRPCRRASGTRARDTYYNRLAFVSNFVSVSVFRRYTYSNELFLPVLGILYVSSKSRKTKK